MSGTSPISSRGTLMATPVGFDRAGSEMHPTGLELLGVLGPWDSAEFGCHPRRLIDLALLVGEPPLGAPLRREASRANETVGTSVPGTPPQAPVASVFDPSCSAHGSAWLVPEQPGSRPCQQSVNDPVISMSAGGPIPFLPAVCSGDINDRSFRRHW